MQMSGLVMLGSGKGRKKVAGAHTQGDVSSGKGSLASQSWARYGERRRMECRHGLCEQSRA